MDRVVVDTDVISYAIKGDTRAKLFEPQLAGREVILSFVTVAELYLWAIQRNWGVTRFDKLRTHLKSFIVQPYTDALALRWAMIVDARRRIGNPIAPNDAWIAATAVRHAVPLITHNRRDFHGIDGLTVVSPGAV